MVFGLGEKVEEHAISNNDKNFALNWMHMALIIIFPHNFPTINQKRPQFCSFLLLQN